MGLVQASLNLYFIALVDRGQQPADIGVVVIEENGQSVLFYHNHSDGPQEMERNEATAKPVFWPSCAWLHLCFFPLPVGIPMSAGCTEKCTKSQRL